jgi:excisionase family DNA binding protein
MPKELVTSSKLAKLLGVSKNTVNRLAKARLIPHVELPSGHRRFDFEEVLACFEAARSKTNEK